MSLSGFLVLSATIIFACIIANKISRKLGVPTLLLFILLGIFFRMGTFFEDVTVSYPLAEKVCSIALMFIIFYGGFSTRWRAARPVAVKAIVLSSLGTVLTAAITAVFCHWILGMSLMEGLVIGSVLGSTDAASVFFILRSRRLNLKDGSASLLEVESGSNDPFAYMMTIIALSAMDGSLSGPAILRLLIFQLGIGVAGGFLIGFLSGYILKKKANWSDGLDTVFVFGAALLSYALPDVLGGNGYLSTYIAGIVIGNHELQNKKNLVNFFDGLTGLMQMILFFLLGLLAYPARMKAAVVPSIAVALILTFIARPAAVAILLLPFKVKLRQYLVLSWAGLRGAASIVFAIMAVNSMQNATYDIFHIVLCVVIFSILLQGSLLPVLAQRLDMIDTASDVMRTFSDYTEEHQMQFLQCEIDASHPWAHHMISQIDLLPNTLIAVVLHEGKTVVPHGDTVVEPGDIVLLCTEGVADLPDVTLKEITISEDHRWCGKYLYQARIPDNIIVLMVKRSGAYIVPDGNTRLARGDVVVAYVKAKAG